VLRCHECRCCGFALHASASSQQRLSLLSATAFIHSPCLCVQNKIQAFWDITRRELGDAKAELLTRERGLEEEQVGGWLGACVS
jgi:hypothetical protein